MDSSGNLSARKELVEELEKAGKVPPGAIRAEADEKIVGAILRRPGSKRLTETEVVYLAKLPRQARMAALGELRRRQKKGTR